LAHGTVPQLAAIAVGNPDLWLRAVEERRYDRGGACVGDDVVDRGRAESLKIFRSTFTLGVHSADSASRIVL
jgi:hypothetical protein